MLLPKHKRHEDNKHLSFIRSLPCCVSGVYGETQSAHIRKGTDGSLGKKPSDNFVVPLSISEHYRQHKIGEVKYWGDRLEAAKELASALFLKTGDKDECLKLIARFRKVKP